MHSWTSTEGKVIQGDFLGLDAEKVRLRVQGKDFAIPLARLSEESRVLALRLAAPVAVVQSQDPADMEKSKAVSFPDFTQTDIAKDLAGEGSQFCAPVSVANSLVWLARQGVPGILNGPDAAPAHRELVDDLARRMETSTDNGTSAEQLAGGLEVFLQRAKIRKPTIFYAGWRPGAGGQPAEDRIADLAWLAKYGSGPDVAWINIGFYRLEGKNGGYIRESGHWISLASLGDRLTVSDPSSRAGSEASKQELAVRALERGSLSGSFKGLPVDSEGYLLISDGLAGKKDRVAIIDGAVALRLPEELRKAVVAKLATGPSR